MSMINMTEFIKTLTTAVNEVVPTTYESAPVESDYCYAVVTGVYFQNPAEHEDSVTFYLDIYASETAPPDDVTLEEYCDIVRNFLHNKTIYSGGKFYAHIGFESGGTTAESETDLSHKRLSFSAKIFYIGG